MIHVKSDILLDPKRPGWCLFNDSNLKIYILSTDTGQWTKYFASLLIFPVNMIVSVKLLKAKPLYVMLSSYVSIFIQLYFIRAVRERRNYYIMAKYIEESPTVSHLITSISNGVIEFESNGNNLKCKFQRYKMQKANYPRVVFGICIFIAMSFGILYWFIFWRS